MSNHDPLCPMGEPPKMATVLCFCTLIAKVREDERQSAGSLVESEDFDGFALGRAVGRAEARDAVVTVQAEAGYDLAINWSEIGNEYAEGWTDLLSLILPAIDAIIDEGRNTG